MNNFLVMPLQADIQSHTGPRGKIVAENIFGHIEEAFLGGFRQKPQFAKFDSENRNGLVPNPPDRAEKGSVSAQNDDT